MKGIMFKLVAIMLVNVLACNKKIFSDDAFSLTRTVNNSNKLRLNGYYYLGDGEQIYDSYFFYSNGILLNLGGSSKSNIYDFDSLENIIKRSINGNETVKEYWGQYEINGNEIKFERYYPSSGGPKPAYIRIGKIHNDTTFTITQSMRSNGQSVSAENEVYHFRPFSPKPDSTNNFIK